MGNRIDIQLVKDKMKTFAEAAEKLDEAVILAGNTPALMKGGLSFMKEFIARNPKQLDICLRMLYSENMRFIVDVKETEQRKIVYAVSINADEQIYEILKEKYRILTS